MASGTALSPAAKATPPRAASAAAAINHVLDAREDAKMSRTSGRPLPQGEINERNALLFATTLNVSLKWMKRRYLLAAVFGGLGGPLAYYAGHRLGAVGFSDIQTALLAVGIGWAFIMPLLMLLAERFDGYSRNNSVLEVNPV